MKFLLAPATTSIMAISLLFLSVDLMANTCSKGDIDYYLQRGFTNDQVVRLCAGTGVAPQAVATGTIQYSGNTPAQNSQSNAIREDQIYLSAALDAKNVQLTSSDLSYTSRECVNYSPHVNTADLDETICADSKVTIKFADLKIIKTSSGLFLIRDALFLVQGDIKREYLNFNAIRRQERRAIRELLPTNPKQANIPVRRGINPRQVADKLKRYIK